MERISSIELAIENEKSEMEYYLGQARRSRNPLARALFETLAEDEKEHMVRLLELHDKLVEDGSWPEDVPIEVNGTNIKSVLKNIVRDRPLPRDQDLGDAEALNLDDIEALKKGIAFEEEGSRFYAELADACDNLQEEKFFRFLSQIERDHMLSMQDSLFYLEDPEGWFDSVGRVGLDGV